MMLSSKLFGAATVVPVRRPAPAAAPIRAPACCPAGCACTYDVQWDCIRWNVGDMQGLCKCWNSCTTARLVWVVQSCSSTEACTRWYKCNLTGS